MRHVKQGVSCKKLQTEFFDALLGLAIFYHESGEVLVITSLNDGRHMNGSFHYKGLAADVRIWNLKTHTPQEMAALLRGHLGKNYDVVVEKDHIHIELDRKV